MSEPEKPSGSRTPPKPRKGPVSLAALVPDAVAPVLHQRGIASTAILTGWADIVGPRLAGWSTPLQIRWPRRPADSEASERRRAARGPARGREDRAERATLVIAAPGAFALEIQMAAPAIVEAVNRRLGYACVGAIEIRQAPRKPPAEPASRRAAPPDLVEATRSRLGDIRDEPLREALARLGAEIAHRNRR